jgi:hypothetical protein
MIISLSKTEYDRLEKTLQIHKQLQESHKGKRWGNEFAICPYCGHRQRRMLPIQEKPIRCLECGKIFTTNEVKK